MVKIVKEVTSGSSVSIALDAAGGSGMRQQRVWRVVLDSPSEIANADFRSLIGVTIGSQHPTLPLLVCDNISISPDGDSRHVYVVTVNYSSVSLSLEAGSVNDQNPDPRTQSPEARKANWSTEATTIEAPSWHWKPINPPAKQGLPNKNGWVMAVNPAGDMYDGIMTMQPVVSIRVEQLQIRDPNQWAMNVGYVNSNNFKIGALNCFARSVMFRGVSATPHVEIVGNTTFRGWKASYEFLFKPGYNSYLGQYLGWDIAVPISGFNVINVAGSQANPLVERGSLSLKLTDDGVGSIAGWENASVIEPTLVNKKSRANVLISAPGAKAMQRPSAQPVALNLDGTPRETDLDPLLQRAQIYMDFNMSLLRLKLD